MNQVDTYSNNNDYTHSFATPSKHSYITPKIPKTITTNTMVQPKVYYRLCQMSFSTSTTSSKIPPSRFFLCCQSYGKYVHADQFYKSRALTKVIDLTLETEPVFKKCVILKGIL